jgi:hypothetical protein
MFALASVCNCVDISPNIADLFDDPFESHPLKLPTELMADIVFNTSRSQRKSFWDKNCL